jgi:hypothetical protein
MCTDCLHIRTPGSGTVSNYLIYAGYALIEPARYTLDRVFIDTRDYRYYSLDSIIVDKC